jgi:hypothetical protein
MADHNPKITKRSSTECDVESFTAKSLETVEYTFDGEPAAKIRLSAGAPFDRTQFPPGTTITAKEVTSKTQVQVSVTWDGPPRGSGNGNGEVNP